MSDMQEYLTVQEAADLLKVHPRTINRWVESGKLAAFRVADTIRIKRADLEPMQNNGHQE